MKQRINSIENLRAISIVCIVAGHSWWVSGQPLDNISLLLLSLVNAGTYFFLFVSGFLFFKLNLIKFDYTIFLKNKFRNLILPYLFYSIFVVTAAVALKHPYPEYFFSDSTDVWHRWIYPWIGYFLTGRAMTGYWYISFIIILFIFSPLFVRFSSFPTKTKILLILIFLLFAGFMQRPIDNMNPLQSLIAFTPAFLIGIFFGENHNKIRISPMIGLILFLIATGIFYARYYSGDLFEGHRFFFSNLNGYENSQLFKSIQVIGLFYILDGWFDKKYSLLDVLAKFSFSIYFLHTIFIFILSKLGLLSTENNYYSWPLNGLLVLCCCLASSLIVKKLLGNKSRYFIGS